MDEATRQRLLAKNENLIAMVTERVKRNFADDIDIIGLSGSFSTNDFHEKSDLDLIIINNKDRAWDMNACFIYDDVGYDIYCTPWDSMERKADFDDQGVSILTDMEILYIAKPECLDRLNKLKEKALKELARPVNADCIARAEKHIDLAKQNFTDMILGNDVSTVKLSSAWLVINLVNSIVHLNNTCIKHGIKRYLEELCAYRHLPNNFKQLYMTVVEAKNEDDIKNASEKLLRAVIRLRDELKKKYVAPPVPDYNNLRGTYEEAYCNCKNKILNSIETGDKSYIFLAAAGGQGYFNEMADVVGTKRFDLMKHYDADNPEKYRDAFLLAMEEFSEEYNKAGRRILRYDDFETLYGDYMGGKMR